MTDDKKVRKLVEAITLIELVREINAKAKDALNEAFIAHLESAKAVTKNAGSIGVEIKPLAWEDVTRQQMMALQMSGQVHSSLNALCGQARWLLADEYAKRESNRQAWADASNGMRKPPFAEGGAE